MPDAITPSISDDVPERGYFRRLFGYGGENRHSVNPLVCTGIRPDVVEHSRRLLDGQVEYVRDLGQPLR